MWNVFSNNLGPVQTPYLSCAVPNTFWLLGRIKRQALPFPEILACLIEICRKKLIWTPYNCQKTTYYLVRHMSGTASELGLSRLPFKSSKSAAKYIIHLPFFFFPVGCRKGYSSISDETHSHYQVERYFYFLLVCNTTVLPGAVLFLRSFYLCNVRRSSGWF